MYYNNYKIISFQLVDVHLNVIADCNDSIFREKRRNIYLILFWAKNSYYLLPYCQLLCCRVQFSNITFINAKKKHRRPYLSGVSRPDLQSHKDVFKKSKKDILATCLKYVFKTSIGHVSWSSILDHMDTFSKCRQVTFLVVTYMTIWRRLSNVIVKRLTIFIAFVV